MRRIIFLLAVLFGFSSNAQAQMCTFESTRFDIDLSHDILSQIYGLPQGMHATTDLRANNRSYWLNYDNEGFKKCTKRESDLNCSGYELDTSMRTIYSKSGQSYNIEPVKYGDITAYCHMKLNDQIGPAVVIEIVNYGRLRWTDIKTLKRDIYPVTFHSDDF